MLALNFAAGTAWGAQRLRRGKDEGTHGGERTQDPGVPQRVGHPRRDGMAALRCLLAQARLPDGRSLVLGALDLAAQDEPLQDAKHRRDQEHRDQRADAAKAR